MFLHTFHPEPIMFSLGPFNIHWYGFIITCGIAIGFLISLRLAKKYGVKRDYIIDLYFWLLIFGILGARLYHVLCEWQYYSANPLDIIKIWNGGLGIYGGVIAGVLVILVYSRRVARDKNLSFISAKGGSASGGIYHLSFSNVFWLTLDLLAPAVALGEAFGRWGNYFNQELFGRPTSLPWGIPINPITLPEAYRGYQFFHPVFLYQSLACFLIFAVILFLHYFRLKSAEESNKTKKQGSPPTGDHPQGDKLSIINYQLLTPGSIFLTYIILYSFSRFFLEFLRTDSQPILFDLRLGQWVSGLLFLAGVGWLARNKETRN